MHVSNKVNSTQLYRRLLRDDLKLMGRRKIGCLNGAFLDYSSFKHKI